jgi:hypothetical protein
LERAIGEFVREYRSNFDAQVSSADGPRALLKAQLAQLAQFEETQRISWFHRFQTMSRKLAPAVALMLGIGFAGYFIAQALVKRQIVHAMAFAVPDPSLTPGATVLVSQGEVCRESNAKNRAVPVALQRRVFEEYGIAGADPRAYEVDYLVTPALGGADDIHNLWPHSYSATVWNAQVKDALEDRLREMVCDGQLDLATAQREIAINWIEAYKKYFKTDRPLATVP